MKSSLLVWSCALCAACAGSGKDGEGGAEEEEPSEPTCETLFGLPGENTGLPPGQCMPRCASCEEHGSFVAQDYSSEDLALLRQRELSDLPALLGSSPFDSPEDYLEGPDGVCGIVLEGDNAYRLVTFVDGSEAEEAGALVTHEGACGACSSLQDLAVYIEVPDLTTPVRRCGLQHIAGDAEDLAGCIAQLGFSDACSEIWAYNTLHTRQECLEECVAALDAPYHLEDGSPNACIQCDEDKSGPVFKAVSGRTRRNSGLPTALCRPCEGLAQLDHHYFSD